MEDRVVLRPRPTQLTPRRVGSQNVPPQVEPPRRKKKRKSKLLQGAFITVGAMALTVLVINASDSFKNPDTMIAGVAGSAEKGSRCPSDMVFVSDSGGGFCIDRYENSPGKQCMHKDPANQFETNDNFSQPLCVSVSVEKVAPWVNIPESQAMEICARSGKHLASNAEWYRAALGTPDTVNTDSNSQHCVLGRVGMSHGEETGSHSACVSSSGAYDMVGNVWEWVDGNVINGMYEKRELPNDGYVIEADTDGVPVKVASSSSDVFHNDYFYVKHDGVSGMLRGGFWNLTDKAGVATVNATIPTSFVGSAVGFRCAK